MDAYSAINTGGMKYMVVPNDKQGWFSIDSIDLHGVNGAELLAAWQDDKDAPKTGYIFELRLDAPDGKKIAEGTLNATSVKDKQKMAKLKFSFEEITDLKKQNLYIVSRPKDKNDDSTIGVGLLELTAK